MSLLLLCQGLAILVAVEKPAYGYVDPGSGLLMFQVGGSMVAGAIFCLRNKFRKLIGFSEKEEQNQAPEKSDTVTESQR
jgi:hypothetical protein